MTSEQQLVNSFIKSLALTPQKWEVITSPKSRFKQQFKAISNGVLEFWPHDIVFTSKDGCIIIMDYKLRLQLKHVALDFFTRFEALKGSQEIEQRVQTINNLISLI